MNRLKKLLTDYREQLLYLVFGGGTTLVNIVVYYILSERLHADKMLSTAVGWVLSVTFAYLTNRKWVFESRARGFAPVLREVVLFYGGRVATGLLDAGIIALFVEGMGMPNMPVKIASNVLVIVLNYIISRLLVFRKTH